jgi:Flp pilus assembly pilin Flp
MRGGVKRMPLSVYVRVATWVRNLRKFGLGREEGQTTAEYALVILAAAAIAVVLITWARSSGKLPGFFDSVVDKVTESA